MIIFWMPATPSRSTSASAPHGTALNLRLLRSSRGQAVDAERILDDLLVRIPPPVPGHTVEVPLRLRHLGARPITIISCAAWTLMTMFGESNSAAYVLGDQLQTCRTCAYATPVRRRVAPAAASRDIDPPTSTPCSSSGRAPCPLATKNVRADAGPPVRRLPSSSPRLTRVDLAGILSIPAPRPETGSLQPQERRQVAVQRRSPGRRPGRGRPASTRVVIPTSFSPGRGVPSSPSRTAPGHDGAASTTSGSDIEKAPAPSQSPVRGQRDVRCSSVPCWRSRSRR